MKTYEGVMTIKWFKNDRGGDRRAVTFDVKDEDELNRKKKRTTDLFLTVGDDQDLPNPVKGRVAYSVHFDLSLRGGEPQKEARFKKVPKRKYYDALNDCIPARFVNMRGRNGFFIGGATEAGHGFYVSVSDDKGTRYYCAPRSIAESDEVLKQQMSELA